MQSFENLPLTLTELGALLGVSCRTVERWRRDGHLSRIGVRESASGARPRFLLSPELLSPSSGTPAPDGGADRPILDRG